MTEYHLSDLTGKIIKACFEVHCTLGPGFRERTYHNAMEVVLEDNNIPYQSEKEYLLNLGEEKLIFID